MEIELGLAEFCLGECVRYSGCWSQSDSLLTLLFRAVNEMSLLEY